MIKRFPLTFRFLVFVIFPILAAVIFLYVHLSASVAPMQGNIQLPGLKQPVQITHDRYGTPSIVAKNDHDAFFALGYKHASDRLWQLEMERRMAQGRLSEILGPVTLQADIWMRTLGLTDAAKQSAKYLSPESIDVITAYADGINAWIKQADHLPPEFEAFGIKPEPWTIYDTLSWQKVFALELDGNMFDEMRRHTLQQHFSPKQINYFYPYDPIEAFTNASTGAISTLIAGSDTLKLIGSGYKYSGSNAWVVAGKYTQSGHPIIANDPHLGLQLPALWYAANVKGDKLDVAGMTLVGLPIVVFGQNPDIAWGGTNLMCDQQDLFIETTSPDHPNQYLSGDTWKYFDSHHEKINISADFPSSMREPLLPIDIVVRQTERGPIISDSRSLGGETISLRWAALDSEDHTIESFIKLQYAKNWTEFRSALSLLKAPGLNFLYADRLDNIGYQVAGMLPKRGAGVGILPQLASNSTNWQGYHDFNELPSILNPETGFIASANEKITHSDNIIISHDWAPSARHERITELLNQNIALNKLMTVDDMSAIQQDKKDVSALELLQYFKKVPVESEQAKRAIAQLNNWDGEFNAESVGATVFATWSYYLTKEIFGGVLHYSWQRPDIEDLLSSSEIRLTWSQMARVLASNEHGWCAQNQPQPCLKELQKSLNSALTQLEKITGNSTVSDWHWASIHRTEFRHHPFGNAKGLQNLFKRTTHSGGSPNSINASNLEFDPNEGFTQSFGAGFRQVFELDNKKSQWYMVSTGESGNLMSTHFDDMVIPFSKGQLALSGAGTNSIGVLQLIPLTGTR